MLNAIPPPFKNSENSVMTQALIYLSSSEDTDSFGNLLST